MKKNIIPVLPALLLISITFLFSSCLKDKCRRTYTLNIPVYTKLSTLRAQVKSTPAAPVVNAGKLFVRNNWIFLNEQNKGIHVIDNSNPSHPVKTAFINIPGNIDMYAKGDILYTDLYCDLLAVNIADPKNITATKYLTNVFPDKSSYTTSLNPDSIQIITSWVSRDTTIDCGSSASPIPYGCIACNYSLPGSSNLYSAASSQTPTTVTAGSMARFAAVDNYLYAVTTSMLNVINITDNTNPLFVQKKNIGWDIETIFPYNNQLYIGAGSNMSIYSLSDPVNPAAISWSGHWCSHDPVVADGNYVYVTLHDANVCGTKVNQLEVYTIDKAAGSPTLIKTYPMTYPQGLSKDGNLLFVCDDGLKIYDATNVADLKLLQHLTGIATYDVIADNGIAYVVGKDGLYQFDYSDKSNIRQLSKLLK